MAEGIPHISTDQAHAFVEVARQGQIRAAASVLAITEQGLRNRLLALEAQLGVELYPQDSRSAPPDAVDRRRSPVPAACAGVPRARTRDV